MNKLDELFFKSDDLRRNLLKRKLGSSLSSGVNNGLFKNSPNKKAVGTSLTGRPLTLKSNDEDIWMVSSEESEAEEEKDCLVEIAAELERKQKFAKEKSSTLSENARNRFILISFSKN